MSAIDDLTVQLIAKVNQLESEEDKDAAIVVIMFALMAGKPQWASVLELITEARP